MCVSVCVWERKCVCRVVVGRDVRMEGADKGNQDDDTSLYHWSGITGQQLMQ